LFETLAQNVAEAPPVQPRPLTQDELLGLFSASQVGRDAVLEPATLIDMMGVELKAKQSLEVIYDAA
jgi:chlorophyllide a reductase subunit X